VNAMMIVCNLVPCSTNSNPTFELWKITNKKEKKERNEIGKIIKPSHMAMAIF
jgi:hypothetical protein